jgi:hypothetical protein
MSEDEQFTHTGDDHDWFHASLKHWKWKELWRELNGKAGDKLWICNTHRCSTFKLVRRKINTNSARAMRARNREEKK